ncbi:MAG TPA: ATP-binding protein [Baekduia sp.]|nr:ATP-binding protein [Baekduia sp.]
MGGPLRRLPIRTRVTLAFTAAMALLLAATGTFLYLRLGDELETTVDQGLQSRAADVNGLVRGNDPGRIERLELGALAEAGEGVTQVVDARTGALLDSTREFHGRRLVTSGQLERARSGTVFVDRPAVADDDPMRLLLTPARTRGRELVLVVGSSVDDRLEAQRGLRRTLLLGGPIALLLAALAGYAVVAAALRPIEAIRRQADAVSAGRLDERVPVPPADDEVRRLGETLNAMLGRLQDAFARERSFTADASHELRTPLSILRTELELALRGDRTREELLEAVRSAAEETDRLSHLAEDLLVIARAEQGRLPVRASDVPARELLGRVRERFAGRAAAHGAALEVDASDDVLLRADPMRLEQALGNLVDNALRHGAGPVVLTAEARDGRAVLRVTDTGPGFPDGFAERAFERFSRADTARSRGGAGLGLAIVALIAEAHGGGATARTRPEGGAELALWVPLSDER